MWGLEVVARETRLVTVSSDRELLVFRLTERGGDGGEGEEGEGGEGEGGRVGEKRKYRELRRGLKVSYADV